MKKILIVLILIILFNINIKVNAVTDSSYILLDAVSGRVLYEKNKDKRFLTASIAKIMTTIVAIEYGDLFDRYIVDFESVNTEGSSIYLEENDEIYLYDLLCGLMLRSGNDAATLISNNVFDDYDKFIYFMNYTARRIGMENSTFENPTGLNNFTYNYSSAYDMAILMRYALDNEIFYEISSKKFHKAETANNIYLWKNKHKLISGTDYVKSGKTGYTKDSGRTLVSYAEIHGLKLIAVSFNEGSDYNLHKLLFEKVEKDFTNITILEKGIYPQEIDFLNYYPEVRKDINLLIKNDSNINIKFNLLKEPFKDCGYFEIYENNKLVYKDLLYPFYPLS